MVQTEKMRINQISDFPTSIDGNHESLYRSYQTLELVKEMLERGDSAETILMVLRYLQQGQPNVGGWFEVDSESTLPYTVDYGF